MKITKTQLRRMIKEELSEISRGNVSVFDAETIAKELSGMGGNRSLTPTDKQDLLDFVRNNFLSWGSSLDAEDAIIDWLVGKRFGNSIDYR